MMRGNSGESHAKSECAYDGGLLDLRELRRTAYEEEAV